MNWKDKINTIINGDCLVELKKFPDECVDLIITSPPYFGLRKYGDYKEQIGLEDSFAEFMVKILEITAELKRILKPTGQFWLNFGDCYSSIGKTGGDIGKNKSEYSISGRARNNDFIEKCLMMMPERIALKMIDEQGWILRNKIKWAKQVLHYKEKKTYGSVMPTSVKDRFNESGEELYFFVKNKKYYSDLDVVRLKNQVVGITDMRDPGILRQRMYDESKFNKFNYRVRDSVKKVGQPQFKASKEEIKNYKKKKSNYDHNPDPRGNLNGGPGSWRYELDNNLEHFNNPNGKNLPSVWLIGSEPHNFNKEFGLDTDHFAIFPQALCEIPIKFGCPMGGVCLDPFMGSGTTALVAQKLGRNYIGIELNREYIKIAEKRLRQQVLI